MVDDIPAVALQKYGITLKRQGKEWHSACFNCGGKDRLITWERGNYYCRQCGAKGWIESNQKPMDLAERAVYLAECIAREKKIEQAHFAAWQEGFKTGYLFGWHDAMTEQHRDWWRAQGIAEEAIDSYVLGYCPKKTVKTDGGTFTTGAYTIPILDPETRKLVNVQYRLDNPPAGVGKYRQEPGIPARNFYAGYLPGGDVLIVEGAKKALVLFYLLEKAVTVVGIPGITPRPERIEELKCFRHKYFLPDPDVKDAPIQKFAERLTDLRVVRLPVKPDDAVVQYHFSKDELRTYCAGARVVA